MKKLCSVKKQTETTTRETSCLQPNIIIIHCHWLKISTIKVLTIYYIVNTLNSESSVSFKTPQANIHNNNIMKRQSISR